MIKWWKLKLIIVLVVAVSSTGCALGLIDKYYTGENKATHADDQSVESSESGGNKGYIKEMKGAGSSLPP